MTTKKKQKRQQFRYDAVVKDLFQQDRPSLLDQLTGGRAVRQFLNPEFAVVEERVADMLVLLEDDSILHVDFQSNNHRDMAYREGIYALITSQKYGRRVEQAVLYLGQAKMRMPDRLDIGGVQVRYRLMDIRELDAAALLASGRPGDLALAMLARGGVERMREIIVEASLLEGAARQRVLSQMVVLAGLRRVSGQLKMEYRRMRLSMSIEENVFLKDAFESGIAKGKAEGMAKGKAEGIAEGQAGLFHDMLEDRFGALPKWAAERVLKATPAEIKRWSKRVLRAHTLEGVLGKR